MPPLSAAETIADTLVARARAGDRDAYDRLFAASRERLELYVRLRLGRGLRGHVDSIDVLQEAYLQAHKDFDAFVSGGALAFARWLCRIAEHRMRWLAEHHGAAKRRAPAGVVAPSRLDDELPASAAGAVTSAHRREVRERLAAALEAMPDDEREVLVLRHFEDRTIDEIAAATDRSATSVRRLLGRATRELGVRLGAAP